MPQWTTSITGRSKNDWDSQWSETTAIDGIHDLRVSVSNNPGGNNPFEVVHTSVSGSLANGRSGWTSYEAYPSGFYSSPSWIDSYQVSPGSHESYSRSIEARTNPTRPAILLPVFYKELADIPRMVKQVGAVAMFFRDHGPKQALRHFRTKHTAEANLAYQFGWRPFVDDLWKMVNFQEAVDRRSRELESLRKKGGLRRRLKKVDVVTKSGITSSDPFDYRAPYTYKSTCVVTGGMVWKPNFQGLTPRSDAQIRRLLTGFTPDNIPANVWAALPWTWFTDYFYDVGEMLQAGNRTLATPERGWVKYEFTTSLSHGSKQPEGANGYTVSPGTCVRKRVLRLPLHSSQTASFPTLEAGQLSILGSLAVVKNRRVLNF